MPEENTQKRKEMKGPDSVHRLLLISQLLAYTTS